VFGVIPMQGYIYIYIVNLFFEKVFDYEKHFHGQSINANDSFWCSLSHWPIAYERFKLSKANFELSPYYHIDRLHNKIPTQQSHTVFIKHLKITKDKTYMLFGL
jgi:hypothetical protein